MIRELYFDPFTAGLYDNQYDFHSKDIAFYINESKKAKGKVLEIACGSGRLLLPILESGCDIEGLDLSPEMLKVLDKKIKAKNLKTRLYNQSMLDFTLDEKYNLVFIPFTSFFILSSQEDQINCLKNCYKHLNEGGKLIVDFFVNSYTITMDQDSRRRFVKEMEFNDETIMMYETAKNNTITQRKTVIYNYEFYNKNSVLVKNELRKIDLRWIYPDEMKLMSKLAGFDEIDIYGDFEYGELVSDRQRLVAVMSK